MTIELSTADKRDGKALALFARWQDRQRGMTRDGRSFFAIPGSEPGLLHMADQNDCSCPNRQRSRNVCKHMRAVRLWMAAYVTEWQARAMACHEMVGVEWWPDGRAAGERGVCWVWRSSVTGSVLRWAALPYRAPDRRPLPDRASQTRWSGNLPAPSGHDSVTR